MKTGIPLNCPVWLHDSLKTWGREYQLGRREYIGWHSKNMIQTMIEHKGFRPDAQIYKPLPVNTMADRIENAVQYMASCPGMFKPSWVLRVEFCHEGPDEVRRERLRAIGLGVSAATYKYTLFSAISFLLPMLDSEKNHKAA